VTARDIPVYFGEGDASTCARHFKSLLVATSFLLFSSMPVIAQPNAASKPPPCAADDAGIRPKAVGGSPGDKARWPWLAAIRLNDQTARASMAVCGGAVIAPNWVLTAAHCFEDINLENHKATFWSPEPGGPKYDAQLEIIIGVDDLRNANASNTYSVNKIIVHEAYGTADKTYLSDYEDYKQGKKAKPVAPALAVGYDVALINIAGSWTGPLATVSALRDTDPLPNSFLQAAGFGLVELGENTMRKYLFGDQTLFAGCARLMEVAMPVVDTDTCRDRYTHGDFTPAIGPKQICAGFDQPSQSDTCTGDSGGPLVANDRNGKPYQVGIVSWGTISCGGVKSTDKPYGVYTRISQFSDWIYSHIGANLQRQDPATVVGPNELQVAFLFNVLRDLEVTIGATKGKVRAKFIQSGRTDDTRRLRLNDYYNLHLSSDVSGRLIVVDIDAAHKVTQVFPNKYTNTEERIRIKVGRSVILPSPGWEFTDFQAQLPLGRSKLIVLVVPDDFPNATIGLEAEEQVTKGIAPVVRKTSYLMNLLQQVAAYSARTRSQGRPLTAEWAYELIDYVVEP
jgi:secreted trypsin-like serine protease